MAMKVFENLLKYDDNHTTDNKIAFLSSTEMDVSTKGYVRELYINNVLLKTHRKLLYQS